MVKRSALKFRSDNLTCNLHCQRCNFIKGDGTRCKNRVCIGAPTCWIHTIRKYGVQVRNSTIDGAGKGLFAVDGFEEGDWIAPYNSDIISHECLELRFPGDVTAPYAVIDCNDIVYDGACYRGIASMANGLFREDGFSRSMNSHNAMLEINHDELWIQATRDINPDEEIFVYYGRDFKLDHQNYRTYRTTVDEDRPC